MVVDLSAVFVIVYDEWQDLSRCLHERVHLCYCVERTWLDMVFTFLRERYYVRIVLKENRDCSMLGYPHIRPLLSGCIPDN